MSAATPELFYKANILIYAKILEWKVCFPRDLADVLVTSNLFAFKFLYLKIYKPIRSVKKIICVW